MAAARGGGGERGGWSSDQLRWDAKMRAREAEALTCRFGAGCRQGLNCPYRHSQEEIQIFADERDLRRRKLMVRCGFCVRGECKFEGCCARSLRVAAATGDQVDSDYESGSADSEGGDIGLAEEGVSDEDDGWRTQGSKGGSVGGDRRAHWGGGEGDDSFSDGGRFAALGVEDVSLREKIALGEGLLDDKPAFCMLTRAGDATYKELRAAVWAGTSGDGAALVAALAAAEGQAARETEAREVRMRDKGMGDRARAGWDRVRTAVSELSWHRFRRVFKKKRRVAVQGPALTVELVGSVLWMAWEWARDGWRREREETAEQTAAELAVRLQQRVQRRQQEDYSGWGYCSGEYSEGYYSGDSSDLEGEAEVVAAALREWDRQHGWLHSPEERAAETKEAERELARVVAALRVWQAAAAAAAAVAAADGAAAVAPAVAPAATAAGEAKAGRAVVAVDEAAAAAEAAASEKAAAAEKAAEELAAETAAIEEAETAEKAAEKLAAAEEAAAANRAAEVKEAAAADRAADKAAEAGARWAAAKEAAAEKAVADKEAATDREAAKEVAVRQATAAGRAAAEVDWRNRKGLGDDYDEETMKWRERYSSILHKQSQVDWETMTGVRLTAEEEAVKKGFMRGHMEVTAAKEEEAAAEWQ